MLAPCGLRIPPPPRTGGLHPATANFHSRRKPRRESPMRLGGSRQDSNARARHLRGRVPAVHLSVDHFCHFLQSGEFHLRTHREPPTFAFCRHPLPHKWHLTTSLAECRIFSEIYTAKAHRRISAEPPDVLKSSTVAPFGLGACEDAARRKRLGPFDTPSTRRPAVRVAFFAAWPGQTARVATRPASLPPR